MKKRNHVSDVEGREDFSEASLCPECPQRNLAKGTHCDISFSDEKDISGMECNPVPRPIRACLKYWLHTNNHCQQGIKKYTANYTYLMSWHTEVTWYYLEQYREIKHMYKQWIPGPFLRFFERVQTCILPLFRNYPYSVLEPTHSDIPGLGHSFAA